MPVVQEFDTESLRYYLPSYYSHLFPTQLMHRWLSYGEDNNFTHREFSFTLAGDVYIRYQSFNSANDFSTELKKRNPEKIDIGAVYNQKPRTRNTVAEFIPLKKEFVLDIDLTDYDDVRTCCQGAKVCSKCWKFIALAVEILDETLRDDFGFEHMLWVFSGRRGVHCWVCDDIGMTATVRSAILEYLTVIRGGESKVKKVTIPNIDRPHPFISRSVKMIDDVFEEICHEDQNLLEQGDKNFEILPEEVKTSVKNSSDRFTDAISYMESKKAEKKTLRAAIDELKLQLCFPRLDVNVSKDLNHLLKSPFCVHPKTGQVCVPFDPNEVRRFKPSEVPTITQLLDEIMSKFGTVKSSTDEDGSGGTQLKNTIGKVDPNQTSLAPYLRLLEDFVKKLEGKQKVAAPEEKTPLVLDF